MVKNKSRKSIFKVLITRIFIIVLLFNIILVVININEAISEKRESNKILKETIRKEIISLVDFQTSSLELIAKSLANTQSEVLHKLYSIHLHEDLKKVDLTKQFSTLKHDSINHSLYIIENGIIVNTTFPTDLGLNFYNLGQDYRNFLIGITEQNDIYNLGFAFEYLTKKLRAYSYLPTDDKKYLIEIGSYSETANEIMLMFKKQLLEIADQNDEIVSLNLWIANQGEKFPLIDDSYNVFTIDTMVSYVFNKQSDLKTEFSLNDQHLVAEFIYFKLSNTLLLPEFTVSILSDITYKNFPVHKIIKRQLVFALITLVLILVVIILATNKIKKVFKDLMEKTTAIAKGAMNQRVTVIGNNEFTTLAEQFNDMVQKLEESHIDLSFKNHVIQDNMKVLQQQTDDMVESITYAQRIQKAALPEEEILNEIIPERFIIFKPRDVVSGDFYWVKQIKNFNIVVAADCTGHGIPGAFMSMLGMSLLNEIVTKSRFDTAGEILNRLRKKIKKILHQTGKDRETKDGMDMAICIIDTESKQLQYAGAFNPLYIYRNKELIEFKGDRMPVGVYVLEKTEFTNHEIELQPGDTVYMFSDGYSDQIGGKNGKKYMAMNLKELLREHSDKPMKDQKEIFEKTLSDWSTGYEQVDDILLMGFRVF